MNEQKYIRRAEALKQRLYRTAVLYLGGEPARWTRPYTRAFVPTGSCGSRSSSTRGSLGSRSRSVIPSCAAGSGSGPWRSCRKQPRSSLTPCRRRRGCAACPGLPEGVRVDGVRRAGDLVEVKLLSPLEREGFGATFQNGYWDPEGNQHSFTRWGGGKELDDDTNQQLGTYEKLYLENYPWDTVELELSYTSVSVYDEPVRVAMG